MSTFQVIASRRGAAAFEKTISTYDGIGSDWGSKRSGDQGTNSTADPVNVQKYIGSGMKWILPLPRDLPKSERGREDFCHMFASTLANELNAKETEVGVLMEPKPTGGAVYPLAMFPGNLLGEYGSGNADSLVEWIRVDDEYMRVDGLVGDENAGKLLVTRGFHGSTPAKHAPGTAVMSPVYLGPSRNRGRKSGVLRQEGGLGVRVERHANGAAVEPPVLVAPQSTLETFNIGDPRRWGTRYDHNT